MKLKRAIKIVKENADYGSEYPEAELRQAQKKLVKFAKKCIKDNKKRIEYSQTQLVAIPLASKYAVGSMYHTCSNCKNTDLTIINNKYCPNCGAKIKWESIE